MTPKFMTKAKIWWDDSFLSVFIDRTINNPMSSDRFWSVEVAMPLSKLIVNESVELPCWINFSDVEWNTIGVNGTYIKDASCQSCAQPGSFEV